MFSIVKYSTILLLLSFLVACSTAGKVGNSLEKTAAKIIPFYEFDKTYIETVSVQSSANSNQNIPVALDIVFISNAEIASTLSSLSGPDWFTNKKGLMMRYQQQIQVVELEVVPQTAQHTVNLPNKFYLAEKVFLFANYLDPKGQYIADVSQYHELGIILNKNGYSLEELDP